MRSIRSIRSDRTDVLVELGLLEEGAVAAVALYAALGVYLHVPVEVELEDERLAAHVADVRPPARVDHQVLRQVALLQTDR